MITHNLKGESMKIRSNGRVYRSDAEWREIISDFSASGLTVSDYSSQHGIRSESLSKAMRRYSDDKPTRESFMEVGSVGEPDGQVATSVYRVELDLGGSMVLRIR